MKCVFLCIDCLLLEKCILIDIDMGIDSDMTRLWVDQTWFRNSISSQNKIRRKRLVEILWRFIWRKWEFICFYWWCVSIFLDEWNYRIDVWWVKLDEIHFNNQLFMSENNCFMYLFHQLANNLKLSLVSFFNKLDK